MADLEFYYDVVCPFAWITSRWVVEVQGQREYDVVWKPISLKMINEHRDEDWYTPEYRAGHMAGLYIHRVADEVERVEGNAAVGRLYTAAGTANHVDKRRKELATEPQAFIAEMLTSIGLDPALAEHAFDDSHDAAIKASTDEAFARTGPDVGTPILTFRPGQPNEGSFFGPVISRIPRGEEALKVWDAVEFMATTPDFSELKRSLRSKLVFD